MDFAAGTGTPAVWPESGEGEAAAVISTLILEPSSTVVVGPSLLSPGAASEAAVAAAASVVDRVVGCSPENLGICCCSEG